METHRKLRTALRKSALVFSLFLMLASVASCGNTDTGRAGERRDEADSDAGGENQAGSLTEALPDISEAETGAEAGENEGAGENAETGEPPVASGAEGAAAPIRPEVGLTTQSIYAYADDGELLVEEHAREPMLTGESTADFPELAKALRDRETARQAEFEEWGEAMLEEAREHYEQYPDSFYSAYTQERDILMLRTDEKIFSFFVSFYEYYGGAHGMYGNFGETYDARTGEKLELADVLADTVDEERLNEALLELLLESYPENLFYEGREKLAEDLSHYGIDYTDPETFDYSAPDFYERYHFNYIWAVSDEGVLFYFGPYELAPYASGSQTVTLSYARYPEFFAPELLPEGNAGFVSAFDGWGAYFDVDGDGAQDSISVGLLYNEDYSQVTGLSVTVNGEKSAEMEDVWIESWEDLGYYFIRTEDGRSYLYVTSLLTNDYYVLCVFDLTGGEPSAVDSAYYVSSYVPAGSGEYDLELVPTDPEHFVLHNRFDVLSTLYCSREYRVGASGMPEPYGDVFGVEWELEQRLVSTVDLDCSIVDEDGNVLVPSEIIPAGTSFLPVRTDDCFYLDAQMEDGRIARLHVTSLDYPGEVLGVPADECFAELYFAG